MDLETGAFGAVLGLAQLLYIAVVTTLGVRLLRLALRSRERPEALLATHFLLCCGLGYVLLIVGLSGARDPGLLPAGAVTALISVGYLSSCIGVFAGIGFNFLVFRRSERWARGLVTVAALALVAGYVGYGLTGGFSHGRFEGAWFWLFYGTYLGGAAWVMLEPLAYHHAMRRRLQLGLAEPLVVNRFLLWGLGSLGRFLMVAGGIVASVMTAGRPTRLAPDTVGLTLLVVALCGIGVSLSYWLTFFPTPRYIRFVERHGVPSSRSSD